MKIVVRAIILNSENKMLFGLRADEPSEGYWSMFGGKPNNNESLELAIVREIKEETGLNLIKFRLWRIDVSNEWKAYYFEGKVKGTIFLNDEHQEVRYFSVEEIVKMENIAFGHKELALQYFEEKKLS